MPRDHPLSLRVRPLMTRVGPHATSDNAAVRTGQFSSQLRWRPRSPAHRGQLRDGVRGGQILDGQERDSRTGRLAASRTKHVATMALQRYRSVLRSLLGCGSSLRESRLQHSRRLRASPQPRRVRSAVQTWADRLACSRPGMPPCGRTAAVSRRHQRMRSPRGASDTASRTGQS